MRLVKIPKRKPGEFREICVPNYKEKAKFREYLPRLNALCFQLCDEKIVHGFMPFKSPVTNASRHIGYQYSLKFDLSNFFDTVTPEMVREYLGAETEQYFINGRAYQGLPTSPQIANLAAIKMDKHISELMGAGELALELNYPDGVPPEKRELYKTVYTRYADDITISFNDYANYALMKESIPMIVEQYGFKVNQGKTRLQSAKFGRRIITGVSVGSEDLKATRRAKKAIRALNYQLMEKKVIVIEDKNAAATITIGQTKTSIPISIKRKKLVKEFKEDKPEWEKNKLKSLIEWSKLRFPRLPAQHTKKVIHAVRDHLQTDAIVQKGLDINVDLGVPSTISDKSYISESIAVLKSKHKVTDKLITQLSRIIFRENREDIAQGIRLKAKTFRKYFEPFKKTR